MYLKLIENAGVQYRSLRPKSSSSVPGSKTQPKVFSVQMSLTTARQRHELEDPFVMSKELLAFVTSPLCQKYCLLN